MAEIAIKGTGLYAPGAPIDNRELKKLTGVEFDEEKLERKLGIQRRHIAHLRDLDETTADFATRAALAAIESSGIDAGDIGLIVVGTDTPEFISPATAIVVQGRIQNGQRSTCSFDVGASCAGFVTAFDSAARIVASDPGVRYGLVIGVYNMPQYIRSGDAFGYSIFADGAAAVIIEKRTDGPGYLGGKFVTDGTQWDFVGVYAGGTRRPITDAILKSGEYGLQLLKPLPGERNVQLWPPLVQDLLRKIGMETKEIDHILFTQINRSVIHQVMEILNLPNEKTTTIMDRYGYTGSACIPMALHHAVKDRKIRRGDLVVCVASGAGLAVGSNAFIY